jgi:hypothetical protein
LARRSALRATWVYRQHFTCRLTLDGGGGRGGGELIDNQGGTVMAADGAVRRALRFAHTHWAIRIVP